MNKPFLITLFLCQSLAGRIFAQAPVITSFSPASGGVGTQVTINGQNFNTNPQKDIVYFSGVQAAVSSANTTQLRVTIPAGAGFEPFSVLNSDLNLIGYSKFAFTPTSGSKPSVARGDFDTTIALFTSMNVSGINYTDIDGDGKPDLVVLNTTDNNYVSIYRNISAKGAITPASFSAKVSFITGGNPGPVLLQDVNGDGKPDLLVLNKYNGSCTYFQNQSVKGVIDANSFAKGIEIGVGSVPVDMALADLDGDGKLDLIATSTYFQQGDLSISQNTSSGGNMSYSNPIDYHSVQVPGAVCVGDIDGDNKPDIILANTDNTISIFQNKSVNNNILLGDRINLPSAHGQPYTIKMADINGDGKLDIILCYNANVITVLRNISTTGVITASSFAAPVDFAVGQTATEAVIADINGDGKPDIVLNNLGISILVNNSTGDTISFSEKTDLNSGLTPESYLKVFDVDGDGKADIVYNFNGQIFAFHGNPQPVVSTQPPPAITSFSPVTGVIGSNVVIKGSNFNGTPASNVVYMGTVKGKVVSANASSLTVQVPAGTSYSPPSVLNIANGLSAAAIIPFVNTFKSTGVVDTSVFKRLPDLFSDWTPQAIITGDLDGDGKPDLVFAHSPGNNYMIGIYRNTTVPDSNFTFATIINIPLLTAAGEIHLADIDGDGKLDIVINYQGTDERYFSIFLNTSITGKISFAPEVDVNMYPFCNSLDIADLNGDGKPDIAAAGHGYDYQVYAYQNTSTPGNISFSSPTRFGLNSLNGSTAAVINMADVDGDHKPDMIISYASTDIVSVFRNSSVNGGIAFEGAKDFITGGSVALLKTGDVNGDGLPDIITGGNTTGTTNISVLTNASAPGKIIFQAPLSLPAGDDIHGLNIGDINGDGRPDIVTANSSNGKISVLQNKSSAGKVMFSAKTDFPSGISSSFLNVTDMNGDGKSDIVATYSQYTSYGSIDGITLLKNKMSAVPVPTITADGPLVLTSGKNVTLTAHPDTAGFTYQWAKDGVNIAGAIKPTYTVTEKGAYTVSITLAPETKTSVPIVVDVKFTLPPTNFKLTITSATCKGSSDGSVNITAMQSLSYTATITGNGVNTPYPFTTSTAINNLAAGSYQVCITVAGQPDYSQCYDVVITEPKDLSVYSVINTDNSLTLGLSGGTLYNIVLNGAVYTTSNNSITLPLGEGTNDLSVTTDRLCQGSFKRLINISGKIIPYPVPFQNTLSLNVGNTPVNSVGVEIHNVSDGKLVYAKQYVNQSGVIQLDLSNLKGGVYALHLSMDTSDKIFKIIKK